GEPNIDRRCERLPSMFLSELPQEMGETHDGPLVLPPWGRCDQQLPVDDLPAEQIVRELLEVVVREPGGLRLRGHRSPPTAARSFREGTTSTAAESRLAERLHLLEDRCVEPGGGRGSSP